MLTTHSSGVVETLDRRGGIWINSTLACSGWERFSRMSQEKRQTQKNQKRFELRKRHKSSSVERQELRWKMEKDDRRTFFFRMKGGHLLNANRLVQTPIDIDQRVCNAIHGSSRGVRWHQTKKTSAAVRRRKITPQLLPSKQGEIIKYLKIQQVHQYKAYLFAQRDTNGKRSRSTWPYISCLKPTRIFPHNQNWEHGQEQIFSSWSWAPMAHKTFTKNTTIYHHNRLSKECINYLALCFVCRWIETSARQQRWLMETASLLRKRELLWVSQHLQTTATSISK